jgi:hypothetical protein
MESENGLGSPAEEVPSLEQELVHQFGPNILGDAGGHTANTDELDEEMSSIPDEHMGAPEDFFDDAPMDLRAGTHVVSSSSEDEEESEPEANPLRAMLKKNVSANTGRDCRHFLAYKLPMVFRFMTDAYVPDDQHERKPASAAFEDRGGERGWKAVQHRDHHA